MKSSKILTKTVSVVLLFLCGITAFAADPTWTRTNYTSSTAFIGKVEINEHDASFPVTVEAGDFIGAFCGDECRMVAKVFSYNGGLYVSSVIQGGDITDMTGSSSEPEEIEWKVWDNSASKLIAKTVYGTLMTESAGEIFDYIIGKPNTNSELKALAVAGTTLSPAFSPATTDYEVSVPFGAALPASADYTATKKDSRATVTVTPATAFDATGKATTTIVVTAEDGTKTTYTITYTQEACATAKPVVAKTEYSYCEGEALPTLSATGKTIKWYNKADLSASGTFPVTGATFTPTAEGTYYVTNTDGCENTDYVAVTVTETPKPVASITSSLKATYCSSDAAVALKGNAAAGTFKVDGTSATSLNLSKLSAGEHIIIYTVTENGCSAEDTKTVAIEKAPVIDLSGVATTMCKAGDAQTLAATPTGGVWSGTGVSAGKFSPANGTSTLTYTVTTAACEASEDVTITVTEPALPTAANETVEKDGAVPTLSATGTNIKWYDEADNVVATTATFKPSVSTSVEKTFTFYVTNTENSCESAKVPVMLTVTSCGTQEPTIAAVPAICDGDAFPTLSATGTNIKWYASATAESTLATGATFTPTAAGTYFASQTAGCEGPRASVSVVVNPKPAAPVVENASMCEGGEIAALSADVAANWYTSKGAAAVASNSKTYTPAKLTATTTFYVNQISADNCASDYATVTYSVTARPAAPKTDATSACLGSETQYFVRMSGSLAAGATLQWYDENGVKKGTESIQDVVVAGAKDYTYSVAQIVDGCESPKANATLTVHALPTPVITLEKSYCSDSHETVAPVVDLQGGDFMIDGILQDDFVPANLSLGSHTVEYAYEDETTGCYGETSVTFSIDDCAAPAVTTISLNQTTLSLLKGETYSDFEVTIAPANAPNTVSWSSSDTKVATVDPATGKVTAVGAGTAVITATSTYTPSKSVTCSVSVVAPVESVSFNNPSDLTVAENGTIDLSQYLVVNPTDASVQSTEWKSSSTSATVANGVVSASTVDKDTEVTITVTVTSEDGTKKTAEVAVTIIKGCALAAPTVNKTSETICQNSDEKASFTATGDASADWIWKDSANKTVATSNKFSTANAGTYYVYQKSGDCVSGKTAVTVTATSCIVQVESVSFNNPTALTVGEGTTLDVSSYLVVNPSDATVKSVAWTSSSAFATVVDGVVTAKDVDENTVVKITATVTSENGTTKSATISITIINGCSLAAPSVAISTQTVCPNSTEKVTFTATGNASADWIWIDENNTVVSSTKTLATAVAGKYYVYQKSGDCESAQTMVSVTEKAKPAAPIVADVAVCEGESGVLTANVTAVWYSSANQELASGKTYAPTSAGTYLAKQRVDGCLSDAATVTYTVNALPSVSIRVAASLQTTDAPATISTSPAGGVLSGTGVSGSKFNPAVGAGTYTVTYTYEDLNGCSNSATAKVTVTNPVYADRTQLGDTIARANAISSLYANDDTYPASAKTILKQAIAVAQSYYDNYTVYTDADLAKQVATLSKAIQTFLDSKTKDVDLKALEAKIQEAYATLSQNEYRKGSSVGEIPAESFTMLQNATQTANAFVANPPKEQAIVNNAVVTLDNAIKAFLESEVKNTISQVAFPTDKIYLVQGEKYTPELSFMPLGATTDYTNFTWTSSNNDVAIVYGSGMIEAKNVGSTAVTVSYSNNPKISDRMVVVVTKIPELVSVSMNSKGNQLYLDFAERMSSPAAEVYSELYIYGKRIPMYNVVNVEYLPFDQKRIVVTLGQYIDDLDNITLVYKGSSLTSAYGAEVPNFEYTMATTAVEDIESASILAYPTQAVSTVTVSGVAEGNTITVVSSLGKKVLTAIAEAETEELNVEQLVSGTYYIMVYDGTTLIGRCAFVKK